MRGILAFVIAGGVLLIARAAAGSECKHEEWKGCERNSAGCCTEPPPPPEEKAEKKKAVVKPAKVPRKVRRALPAGRASRACRKQTAGDCYTAALAKKDRFDAAVDLGHSCSRRHGAACRELGLRTFEGVGVAKNDAHGFTLVDYGCTLGDPAACGVAGFAYATGRGVEADEARGIELSERGCNGRAAFACTNAGTWLEDTDPERAVSFFLTACAIEDTHCEGIGRMYLEGRGGLTEDRGMAIVRFTLACDAGNGSACGRIGAIHEADGDILEASDWYERGCLRPRPAEWVCEGYRRMEEAMPAYIAELQKKIDAENAKQDPPPAAAPPPAADPTPPPVTPPPVRTAAADPTPVVAPPPRGSRSDGRWRMPRIPGVRWFGRMPMQMNVGVDVSVYSPPVTPQGEDGATLPAIEAGRAYWVRVSTVVPGGWLITARGGYHDVDRSPHDTGLDAHLNVVRPIVSWPRFDRYTFSLVNLAVGPFVSMSALSVGGEVTSFTRVTCHLGVTVSYRHPLTSYYPDVPQLIVGIGVDPFGKSSIATGPCEQ